MKRVRSVIVGSGCHIPSEVVPNAAFLGHEFLGPDGRRLDRSNEEILAQFEAITGIRERRYVPPNLVNSDIACDAARRALESSGVDGESLDIVVLAHNFGDVRHRAYRSDTVPALASRVKAMLKIRNPATVAVDLVFGCPGWLQGVIQCDAMIRAGDVRRALVIGSDTLSRISDPHDRDSLIYADGAGAVILEARQTEDEGFLAHAVRSDTYEHSGMLHMDRSYKPDGFLEALFLKMEGRKLYKYALNQVAGAMHAALDRARIPLAEVKKVLIHQANGKMDDAILREFYAIGGVKEPPAEVMPMTISWLGNSSVATVPTLLDLIRKERLDGHRLDPGDVVVFASVGAGMNINAAVYRMPR